MPNAVNSAQYQARIKQAETLFEGRNFIRRQTINLSGGYEIVKDAYGPSAASFGGGEYVLFGASQIISWRCIDDRAEFFSLIRHADGKFYLVFRQDLYGYSVLDLASAQIMRFVPDAWLDSKESFIWDGVHLVSFAEPMSEEQRYVDVLDCMQGGYDIYEQADFAGFEGNKLSLKCFRADALRYENIKISCERYCEWMREAKRL